MFVAFQNMQQLKSFKYIGAGILVLIALAWVLSSNPEQQSQAQTTEVSPTVKTSSVIQPISQPKNLPNQQYQNQFAAAVALVDSNPQQAEQAFKKLIQQNPSVIEAYINLSAILAEQNKIEESTEVLLKGLQADSTTATAFNNLQQLHGAMAAQAYQQALVETSKQSRVKPKMTISKVAHLSNQSPELEKAKNDIKNFKQQIALKDKQISQFQLGVTQQQDNDQAQLTIAKLEKQLADLKQQFEVNQGDYQNQIAALNKKLQQAAETQVVAINPSQSQTSGSQPTNSNANNEVVAKVKSWAAAWSNQNVAAYIAHYKTGYRPSSGVSNREWRKQRQIRLSNKKFIRVKVSNFSVKPQADKVVVNFTQHYRSNTMDDSIRKQLVFSAANGDWKNAKIVAEQVLR